MGGGAKTRLTRFQWMKNNWNPCVWCGATEELTVDHIYARCLGGRNERSNYQILCRSCNNKKSRVEQEILIERDPSKVQHRSPLYLLSFEDLNKVYEKRLCFIADLEAGRIVNNKKARKHAKEIKFLLNELNQRIFMCY